VGSDVIFEVPDWRRWLGQLVRSGNSSGYGRRRAAVAVGSLRGV